MSYHHPPTDLYRLRRKTRLNQHDFWKQVGVTQSAGSRYESGRPVPEPVLILIDLVYVQKLPLKKLNATDHAIGAMLREEYAQLYEELAQSLKNRQEVKA